MSKIVRDKFDSCGLSQMVHLSIDDVGASLRWICENSPKSIWDMNFFGKIKALHDCYGAEFTLYCFYEIGAGFSFIDILQIYAEQFAQCAEWLKFGFHSINSTPFADCDEWVEQFDNFLSVLERFSMGTTNILRLHYWKATKQSANLLRAKGVTTLLYHKDDDRYINDAFIDNDLLYRKTNTCFEKLNDLQDKEALNIGRAVLVAFTHEKVFMQQAEKIEASLKLYCESGYSFIS